MNETATVDACCPPIEAPSHAYSEDLESVERLAELAKAIGHPARVRILMHLIAADSCVCGEFVSQLDLAQSTVSQHLKVLKEVGLIRGTIQGPSTCYCVDNDGLRALRLLVAGL